MLTVNGSGFSSATIVNWNGTPLLTNFVSTTQVTASVPASDVVTAGSAQVTVALSTGGAASAAVTFTITVAPVINSLFPSTVLAGDGGFTLTVNGTGFAASSVVNWNGIALTTTFVSATQLTASVPDANVATAGSAQVTVANTSPAGTSNAATFTIGAVAVIPLPTIVSADFANANLTGNNVSSNPVADARGRFVAFESLATNLISNYASVTGTTSDIYVRDTCVHAPASCTPSTILASVDGNGNTCRPPPGMQAAGSTQASMSSDGRFVAFETNTCFLGISLSGNSHEIALRDTCNSPSGLVPQCIPSTALISANTAGHISGSNSIFPTISANGRFVAFLSDASGLVAGVTGNGGQQVYFHDTCNSSSGLIVNCLPQTQLVSGGLNGNTPVPSSGAISFPASVSDSGVVVFDFAGAALAGNSNLNNVDQIFHAVCSTTPNSCLSSLSIVTVTPGPGSAPGNGASDSARISADGRFVAFDTVATNLIPNLSFSDRQVALYDSCVSQGNAIANCTPSFSLVSADNNGNPGTGPSRQSAFASVSADGRFVGFVSSATNLTADDPGTSFQYYVRDTCEGSNAPMNCAPSTMLASINQQGTTLGSVSSGALSRDGHFVSFFSFLAGAFPANQIVLAISKF